MGLFNADRNPNNFIFFNKVYSLVISWCPINYACNSTIL